jgi:hypothetical protein
MNLLTLIPVIGIIGSIATFIAKLIVLIWVFYQSKKIAAIAYLGFLVIDLFVYKWVTELLFKSIQSGEAMMWLGELTGERMSNFLYLQRFIPSIIEPILFVWLLVSLIRRK